MRQALADPEQVRTLTERELQTFAARTSLSREVRERAKRSLPLGVPSSFQDFIPYPVYVREAKGCRIWDVDGNEYRDFHMGFGTLAVGHAHPRLVEALSEQLARGSMYALACEEAFFLAEEICRRVRMQSAQEKKGGNPQ